jgi:hypothetical protein
LFVRKITLEKSKAFYFRIPELHGPIDAEFFHGFNEPQFYMPGNNGDEKTKNRK